MTKKKISIIAFIVVIAIGIGMLFAHSKIETPDQHAENAAKISQIAEKGKKVTSSPSVKSEDSTDKTQKNANENQKSDNKSDSKAAAKEDNKNTVGTNNEANKTQTAVANSSDSNYQQLVDNANHHTDSNTKDKYLTDPTPPGMPKPVEPQNVKIDSSCVNYCTLSIRCDTILKNIDDLKKSKKCEVPQNGVIYETKTVAYFNGESVFNLLVRETAKNKIQMDFVNTPIYNSAYIRGIHNLYEFDCGNLSGWMYKVDGWFPNYGCSRYQLKPGDKVEWVYTCDLGKDVGCIWVGDKK